MTESLTASRNEDQKTIAVIGDGWAALGAVGFLVTEGQEVRWIPGTGARLLSPLPMLEADSAAPEAWSELASRLGVECSPARSGSFLREFRNKSFREPAWCRESSREERQAKRAESLWAPEVWITPDVEVRFEQSVIEIEEACRARLTGEGAAERYPNLKRCEEGVPVTEIRWGEGAAGMSIVLGSGAEVACSRVVYADRWSAAAGIEGLPKALPFTRNREPVGALQAVFAHRAPIASEVCEGFFSSLHREAKEEFERHVFGGFFANGTRSLWTVLLTSDEVEDNHEIAKKLRRLKQGLDRMFVGPEWLPEGITEFTASVVGEQVRFEGDVIFSRGSPPAENLVLGRNKHLAKTRLADGQIGFLTDGYGPSNAFLQTLRLLGLELRPATASALAESSVEATLLDTGAAPPA